MLNKMYIMCTIIINIEMILFNNMMIIVGDFYIIDIALCMSIYNMDKYRNLVRMIILTLYLFL
jgi:hypothetical protein